MTSALHVCALLALIVPAPFALAQDRDGDGIPDDIEVLLGTNPDLDEGLQLVLDDKTRGQGDRNIGPGPDAPDIDQVFFAHAGGDRYVWKVTFADDYPESGAVFHLYVDLDDDRATGRQDADWVRGVDVMYTLVDARDNSRVINPAVRANPAIPIRILVRDNVIYISDDLNLNIRDGQTHFRMYLLSHMKDPTSDNDTTDWVYVNVPVHPDREAPPLPYPTPENFERIATPGLAQLTYNLWQDPRTVRLLPQDAAVAGYTVLMNDDFDGAGEAGEAAIWRSPVAGDYHIGLILREEPGRLEGLDVHVGAEKVGTVVGYSPSRRDALHFTAAPVSLGAGDDIAVRTAAHSAPVRFQGVCLLAERPQVPPLTIENITAWHIPDEPGERRGRIMVAWTTNRPSHAAVRYSLAGPEAFEQSGEIEEGRDAVNNHFILLPPELDASGYRLEIACVEPAQEDFEAHTATAEFTVWRDPARHAASLGRELDPPAGPVRIPLTVHEPTGAGRAAWPVSSGVPLPEGALDDPAACRLLDADGAEVPAQFKALAWWPGSVHVKWLLVDFMARTEAGADAAYTLEVNAHPARATGGVTLEARRPDTAPDAPLGPVELPLRVNTGPLNLVLEAGGFAPFANVTVHGRPVSGADLRACGFEIADEHGVVYSSALEAPEEVVIEDEGPLRATVLVRGRLVSADGGAFMRYLCRMHFHAGQPYVRTVFTLENDVMAPDMNLFGAVQVRVPAALRGAQFSYGADGEAHALETGGRLLQDEDHRFTAGDEEGRRADGWLLARTDARAVAVAVRDFWQLYPKGFRVDDTGITLEPHPALPSDQYADANEDDITKLYFWCDEGRYKIRTGVRLTTEFAVDFAPETTGDAPARYAAGAWWSRPLFAACTPEWYTSSGAFGEMIPRAEGKFEVYERSLDSAFERFLARREAVREYGFMNYGDWFGERTWNWGNQEYDTQWALAANFARTGNLAMLWRAVEAETHNADIDTTHHWPDPRMVGSVYIHSTGHTGGYFPDEWKDMGWANRGGRDTGHTYAQGHFYLHALTGEPRFLETGRKVAEWFAARSTDFRYYAERNVGWPLIGLMGAHHVEGNPVYLNAAKLMADMAKWTQHPERGGWGHFQDPNECKHEPRCWGAKPFMTGVLLHGLKMYDYSQPREDIREVIRLNCDFLWRETYVRRDQGFCYSQCETFAERGGPWTISLVGSGLAYGCLLDPDRRHRDLVLEATAAYMHRAPVSDFGKSFTQGTCFMPLMLHDLAQLGLTEIPEPPPAGAEPRAELRESVFLAAGERRTVHPLLSNPSADPAPCTMTVRGAGAEWFITPQSVNWKTPPGVSFGPPVVVQPPADTPAEAQQSLAVRVGMDDETWRYRVRATVVAPADLGEEVGWVSGAGDPLRLAAEALGVEPLLIDDVPSADLGRFGSIIIGSEAFYKGFARVQEAANPLARWVASGGRLIVGQLQDVDWRLELLPCDVVLSDISDHSADIVEPDHPLFTTPHRLDDLSGIISYDSIILADPTWRVLARNARGGPGILEAAVGAGTVLVVMPSFDRPVVNAAENPERSEMCAMFMENLLAYAGPPTTAGQPSTGA